MKTKSKILSLFSGLFLATLSIFSYAESQQYSFAGNAFNAVNLNGNIKATIQVINQLDATEPNTVTVTASAKSLPEVKVYVENNTLYVSKKGNNEGGYTTIGNNFFGNSIVYQFGSMTIHQQIGNMVINGNSKVTINGQDYSKTNISQDEEIIVNITVNYLQGIELNGTSSCTIDSVEAEQFNAAIFGVGRCLIGSIKTDDLDLELSSSGNYQINNIFANKVSAAISGSGGITLIGKAKNLDITISGSGNISAKQLITEQAKVKISGSGNVNVNATRLLDARVSGMGNIRYYGNPQDVKQRVTGMGNITKGD